MQQERYRAATGFREILQTTVVRCGSEETTFGVRRESQFKCRGRCEKTRSLSSFRPHQFPEAYLREASVAGKVEEVPDSRELL